MTQNFDKPVIARVELTGFNKNGTSMKSGTPRPWWRLGAYVQVQGLLHPQAIEIFTFNVEDVKPAGVYTTVCSTQIRDGRIQLEIDLSQLNPAQK